ncbi:MAG TPA: 23S rRNA (adenine(2503)-C(2))-methyltransferase RlmN [Firmicutes bacterium]|nr:23S rRNA (adenine(2503)-C(2))-methyltransferase RlmN [Bacillota bacterium]HBN00783.1 23S rRNA (adenine(2503)-C(2))-methyltransferase RlmN [Bacillota bacterium]
MKKNLFGYTLKALEEEMLSLGEKKFRAIQLYTWIYVKKVYDFDSMTDISKNFRETLKENYCLTLPKIYAKQVAEDGTIKLLLEMEDGAKVETVLMRYDYGNAICVSSQVGCAMGCAFCASGLLKKERNLTSAEMVGEVIVMNQILYEVGENVTHIVVMGTGEPFDNYDNVSSFIHIMNEAKGLSIGARHITVSTCGIVPGIEKYANEGIQVNLAISLHAPNNAIRSSLMKVNNAYPLEKLIPAVKEYVEKSGRRVTFEYIMIKGVNDSIENAKELVELLRGVFCYVNLIPLNPVKEKPFERSEKETTKRFSVYLNSHGVNCTVRKEWGTGIDAACGQLRAKVMKGE